MRLDFEKPSCDSHPNVGVNEGPNAASKAAGSPRKRRQRERVSGDTTALRDAEGTKAG
jgi:hypothetical protein